MNDEETKSVKNILMIYGCPRSPNEARIFIDRVTKFTMDQKRLSTLLDIKHPSNLNAWLRQFGAPRSGIGIAVIKWANKIYSNK